MKPNYKSSYQTFLDIFAGFYGAVLEAISTLMDEGHIKADRDRGKIEVARSTIKVDRLQNTPRPGQARPGQLD
jgi:hypothetical protein